MRTRTIGRYTAGNPGPLLICLGAMHGNEHAGVKAIELMIKMLEVEPITNPSFSYQGEFIGLIGNLEAYIINQRFITRDLNRSWTPHNVAEVLSAAPETLLHEDEEMRELYELVRQLIDENPNRKIIILDLHTTSSTGGIFGIPNEDPESYELARHLNAPVILDMMKGIRGSTLNFFTRENFDADLTTVVFESGQHLDPLSVNRAIAGITNIMAHIGAIDRNDIENQHNEILAAYSKDLPHVTRLVSKFFIEDITKFRMLPGYENFQPVQQGEHLADYDGEKVYAAIDGRILMPLYQSQGEDGFFLVQDVDTSAELLPARDEVESKR